MSEWNDVLFFNEADKEEKKTETKDDDKKKSEDKDDKNKDDEYNDLMDDESEDDEDLFSDDDEDEDFFSDDDEDDESNDDDYTDLIGDTDVTDNDDISDDEGDSDYNTIVVVKTDDESGSSDVYEAAAKVGYAYVVIANNMKHIHLNACGDKFEEIHRMSEDFFNHFNYLADPYFELAAQSRMTKLDNPSRSKEHIEDIEVESKPEYDFNTALEAIDSQIRSAIKYVSILRDESESDRKDVQSKCDDELQYLNAQSKYFIRKRLTCLPYSPLGESCCYNELF